MSPNCDGLETEAISAPCANVFQYNYNGWLKTEADQTLQRLCKGAVTICEENASFAINKIAH
jgi:hypothetical protein